ncbi:MAG: GNAT family N-acetyltransferase [Cyanobacteria bacterium J06626_14]
MRPKFLTPQTPWILENVVVLPEARGHSLGKALLKTLFNEGRSQQRHAGIMV